MSAVPANCSVQQQQQQQALINKSPKPLSNSNSSLAKQQQQQKQRQKKQKKQQTKSTLPGRSNGGQMRRLAHASSDHSSSGGGGGGGIHSDDDRFEDEGSPARGRGSGGGSSHTCCLFWCCCCTCLTTQPGRQDESSRTSGNNTQPPKEPSMRDLDSISKDEAKVWGESFDKLMQSPNGRKAFREFLKSEYSEENILFWLACEDLKKEVTPEAVEERARVIYEDYISILSPKEVSLDARVREIINKNMVEPNAHTFDDAQVQIFTLMHRDSYPRFLNSQFYKLLVTGSKDGSGGGGCGKST